MAGFFARTLRPKREYDAADPSSTVGAGGHALQVELLDSFEHAGLGWFWATDANGHLIYLSQSAAPILGREIDSVLGKPMADLFDCQSSEDGEGHDRPLTFLFGARNVISRLPVKLAGPDEAVWWEIAGKPAFDARGGFTGYRGSAKDISAERASQRDAERLAQYDALTGLANRNRMDKRLGTTLNAYRNSKRFCTLLTLNLDRFKQVNDTLGVPAGDELLKQAAARLERLVGNKGEVGRTGGDEFQIMLPDVDDRGVLGEQASRIIQMVSQPYSVNGSRAIIGCSVGMATAPYDGLDADELVTAAQLAMHAAKSGGRGQYRFYSSDLKDGAKMRRRTEEDLRDAIHRDELRMFYQPIVDAKTHKLKALEALMRWDHPERGNVPPSEFIPVAEDIGIIRQIGDWALHEVCRQAQEWPIELRVAVNVSAIQFANDDFPVVVQRALQASGLDPRRLELEITESVFMGDNGRTQRMFEELKQLGVRLALDDFGTGYSSLSYLRTAPFDKIKIDQSFVRGATEEGNNNAAIMSAIVGLAEALNMETVAEGVETQDELTLVCNRRADSVQGYIFSRPILHEEVLDMLERGELTYEPRGPAKYRAERKTVFRRVGLIHDDHRYKVVLRNISKTGAMIEGLLEVPLGTEVVLDLGGGQLAVATVRRSFAHTQGLEFEMPLISDGADGLCTRHRVSPYAIEAAGSPLAALPKDAYSLLAGAGAISTAGRRFMQLDPHPPSAREAHR